MLSTHAFISYQLRDMKKYVGGDNSIVIATYTGYLLILGTFVQDSMEQSRYCWYKRSKTSIVGPWGTNHHYGQNRSK